MTTPSYSAISAIGVPFGVNQRWVNVDISAASVASLYTTYRVLQLKLNMIGSPTPVYLLLSAIASTYSNYTGTVSALLTAVGTTALPTTTTALVLNPAAATFMDAFRAGYSATPVNSDNQLVPSVPPTSLPDIRLTRNDISLDYTHFVNNALVSINGFYHYSTSDGINGVHVKDAVKSLNLSGQNEIGIWNFTKVGTLATVPITAGMVNNTVSKNPVITLPSSTDGKYVFLVLGGYPIYIDGQALTQLSSTSFSINFSLLNIVQRFYESGNYLDLGTIISSGNLSGFAGVTLDQLSTPEVILAWLELSQSYFVIVNNPEIFIQKQYVRRIGLPNQYLSYKDPAYPLVLVLGRHPSYWKVAEDQQWRIAIYNNVIGNTLYNVSPVPSTLITNGSDQPGMPGMLQEAYLLELGCDVASV